MFALSAAIAGLAGGLFAQLRETVAASDFQLFNNLPLLLFAVIAGRDVGVRRVARRSCC